MYIEFHNRSISSQSFLKHRDVDKFVEKLDSTVKFFRNLENPGNEESKDDFVPFI
jgi:hypothetical protein